MKHLQIFNSHEEFESAKENLISPCVAVDNEHVHYKEDNNIDLPLGVDGVENGYGYVDLGLPSGTKWATCNIGATTPCEPGLLFQWGRSNGYVYGDENHQFTDTSSWTTTSGILYYYDEALKKEDDAAAVNMGGKWRMPTQYDMQELVDNTTNSWVNCNVEHEGEHTTIPGRLFVSKNDESKKLFFPASGYYDSFLDTNGFHNLSSEGDYWSCECSYFTGKRGYKMHFISNYMDCDNMEDAPFGLSVRGVWYDGPVGEDGIENGYEYVDLGLPSGTKWAKCNVGATNQNDLGLLFQWGRVDGYAYGDENNQFITDKESYTTTSGKTYVDREVLSLEDDAASVIMGGRWHMPTKEDIEELNKYTYRYNTAHDMGYGEYSSGILLVSKKDESKKLFIPSAIFEDSTDNKDYSAIWSSTNDSSSYKTAFAGCSGYRDGNWDYFVSEHLAKYPIRGVCK